MKILTRALGIIIYLFLKNISLKFIVPKRYSHWIESLRTWALVLQGALIGRGSIVRNGVFVAYPKKLQLGENVTIGPFSKIFNYADVSIGNNTEIGPGLHIQTNDHKWTDKTLPLGKQGSYIKDTVVGEGVFIGANVTILRGVVIQDYCVVAACSVVVNDLQSGCIYAGVPAKIIGHL